jgi:hypothetical protein
LDVEAQGFFDLAMPRRVSFAAESQLHAHAQVRKQTKSVGGSCFRSIQIRFLTFPEEKK